MLVRESTKGATSLDREKIFEIGYYRGFEG
jgi:hypothetical protein